MSIRKRDTMRRSSEALVLRALFAILLFATPVISWAQNASATQSQPSNSQSSQQYQQPVQDLTPPSDAEAERAAAPAPAPNQPTDTVQRQTTAPSKKNKDDQYVFKKDVDEVVLYATV